MSDNEAPIPIEEAPKESGEWERSANKAFKTGNLADLSRSMKHVLRIAFSGKVFGRDMLMVVMYLAVLIAKTAWTVRAAKVEGRMLKGLMDGNIQMTLEAMSSWLAGGIPMSLMNGAIRHLNQSLAFSLRNNMMTYANSLYFTKDTYYHVNTSRECAVPAADQLMTDDFNHWAQRLSNLVSFVLKPIFHVVVYTVLLYRTFGFRSQTIASATICGVGYLLHKLQPDFSTDLAKRRLLEANLRQEHHQIKEYAEEIALSKGGEREGSRVASLSSYLISYLQKSMVSQTKYFVVEDFIIKYVWSSVGLGQLAVLLHQRKGNPLAWSVEAVMFARRMLAKQSSSTQQLMRGLKSLQEFIWFTNKLSTELREVERKSQLPFHTKGIEEAQSDLVLSVRNIALTLPTGRVLVEDFSLDVSRGERILFMGPNGCGKSTLLRILRGLWVSSKGGIVVPPSMMFVPQRPYVAHECTFRQLITFPSEVCQSSDEELQDLLELCLLSRVCEMYGGLNSKYVWGDVLSGGEKQRVNLARVLYHKPDVVALDESTSAIDTQAEDCIFGTLMSQRGDTTILTVSHRRSLVDYHDRIVVFDGDGGYQVSSCK